MKLRISPGCFGRCSGSTRCFRSFPILSSRMPQEFRRVFLSFPDVGFVHPWKLRRAFLSVPNGERGAGSQQGGACGGSAWDVGKRKRVRQRRQQNGRRHMTTGPTTYARVGFSLDIRWFGDRVGFSATPPLFARNPDCVSFNTDATAIFEKR